MATFTRKPQQVGAIKLMGDGSIIDSSTTPPATLTFKNGDWLVWRLNGKTEILKDNAFKERYQPLAGDDVAEAMYSGTIDPNAG